MELSSSKYRLEISRSYRVLFSLILVQMSMMNPLRPFPLVHWSNLHSIMYSSPIDLFSSAENDVRMVSSFIGPMYSSINPSVNSSVWI